jgi:hypothetical protein
VDIKEEGNLADPYSMFVYAIKSPLTRKKYEGRLAKFLDHAGIAGETLEVCNFRKIFEISIDISQDAELEASRTSFHNDAYYGLTALSDWRPIICNESNLSYWHW